MELDQLKTLWKRADEKLPTLSDSHIEGILRHRSQRPIARMKRNLKLEIVFLTLLYAPLIWYFSISFEKIYIYYDIILIVSAITFLIYARYKYKLLHKMECASCEVKSNLSVRVNMLEKLVKLYFYWGNISAVLGYLISVVISYIGLFTEQGKEIRVPSMLEITILVSIGAVFILLAYFVNRWYIFKLYGQHIQNLKTLLLEMDKKTDQK